MLLNLAHYLLTLLTYFTHQELTALLYILSYKPKVKDLKHKRFKVFSDVLHYIQLLPITERMPNAPCPVQGFSLVKRDHMVKMHVSELFFLLQTLRLLRKQASNPIVIGM